MTEQHDQNRPQDPNQPEHLGVPIEQDETPEPEHPRREASAEFLVQSEVQSSVALRDAMNPANQSLAEALRLSYRVLQLVIVVLVVLFFTSGFRTVESNQSGVFTRFGKIVPVGGTEALESGFQPTLWPYPIGEFVIFDVENRNVDISTDFWPRLREGQTLDEATQRASVSDVLRPGIDGSLLTEDGGLAHLRLNAKYQIDDPVRFVTQVPETYIDGVPDPADNLVKPKDAADKLVRVAVKRAAVRHAASSSLQRVLDADEDLRYRIRQDAQALLDQIDSGIRLVSINIPDAIPPLAIKRTFNDLQDATLEAQRRIAEARKEAEDTLVGAAGEYYGELITLIREYERALDTGSAEAADAVLARMNAQLESDRTSGTASRIIARAQNYSSEIESTLGNEYQRFEAIRDQYRNQPDLVIQRLLWESYGGVFNQPDVETLFVPAGDGPVALNLATLQEVAEARREAELAFKEQQRREQTLTEELIDQYRMRRAGDIILDGPGRRLRVDDDSGRAAGRRNDSR